MGKRKGSSWRWKGQTFRYSEEFVRYAPDHPHPRFGVVVHVPLPWQTEAQNAVCRRENEEEAERLGIRLSLMQAAAVELGHAGRCRIPRCRRLRRCVGRRNENDWDSFPLGPIAPPCLADAHAVEQARLHTRKFVRAVLIQNGETDNLPPPPEADPAYDPFPAPGGKDLANSTDAGWQEAGPGANVAAAAPDAPSEGDGPGFYAAQAGSGRRPAVKRL